MVESRLIKLRFDKHIEEPSKNVFLCDYLKTIGKNEESDEYLSVMDILKIWRYEKFYEQMIEEFRRKIKDNPDENVCVYYDNGAFSQNKNEQKLLGWDIYDERNKKFILVGGVLFHNDKMSFHT